MIYLEPKDQNNTIISEFPNSTDYCMVSINSPKGQVVSQNIWDCIGDILMEASINDCQKNSSYPHKQIVVKCSTIDFPRYYSIDSILLMYLAQKKKGWNIRMESQNIFSIECPEFDKSPNALMIPSMNNIAMNNRNYAHPIDSSIINLLDSPGVKTVVGSAVDMLTDLNFSQILSSGIPVSDSSFPEINEIIELCSGILGIKRPYAVISSSIGMNAFAVGSDDDPCIVLGNMLVRVMDKEKLTFIIGHECGHVAMGHMMYHSLVSTAGSFSRSIPLIGPTVFKGISLALNAWSRRSEITADRAGLLCCQSLDESKKALLQLESGFISADNIDYENYIQNSKRYRRRSTLRRISEFSLQHPPLSKRMEALDLFANSTVYYEAQGKIAPQNCLSSFALTSRVEHVLNVLGEE